MAITWAFPCMFQPAGGARTSSDRDRTQGGRQRPREPHGFYCATVHAVTLVARGSVAADVGRDPATWNNKEVPRIAARAVFLPVESI